MVELADVARVQVGYKCDVMLSDFQFQWVIKLIGEFLLGLKPCCIP
jgi:hypothetical protein